MRGGRLRLVSFLTSPPSRIKTTNIRQRLHLTKFEKEPVFSIVLNQPIVGLILKGLRATGHHALAHLPGIAKRGGVVAAAATGVQEIWT